MHEITPSADSIHNLLQRIRALADRPRRQAERCFWIEGVRHFVQASDARWPIDTILYSPILLKSDLADMLGRRLHRIGVCRVRVTPEQFRSISTAERASGIGAILQQRWTSLAQLDPRRGLCVLVVEQVRSPGNLGTILRTAEALGVGGIIFLGELSDPFHPAVVRASMGGILHLPLVRTTHVQLGQWMRAHRVELVGLAPDADALWTGLPSGTRFALALGEERQGLSPALRRMCRHAVRLPMSGRADSLNVGVAAGVMMYELVRRRLIGD